MGITTLLPAADISQSRITEDVLACLRRQPGVPLDLTLVAESLAGVTPAQVEHAVRKLEGPSPGYEQDAYVHFCRLNHRAVFIP